jgi:hypothetical protein
MTVKNCSRVGASRLVIRPGPKLRAAVRLEPDVMIHASIRKRIGNSRCEFPDLGNRKSRVTGNHVRAGVVIRPRPFALLAAISGNNEAGRNDPRRRETHRAAEAFGQVLSGPHASRRKAACSAAIRDAGARTLGLWSAVGWSARSIRQPFRQSLLPRWFLLLSKREGSPGLSPYTGPNRAAGKH